MMLKASKKQIMAFICCFLLHIALFRVYIIPNVAYKLISLVILVCIFGALGLNTKRLKENKIVIIFGLIILLLTYFSKPGLINLLDGLMEALRIIDIFLFIDAFTNGKDKNNNLCLDSLYYVTLAVMVIFDISVLLNVSINNDYGLVNYVFGNKFMLSYFHMAFLSFLAMRWREKMVRYPRYKVLYTIIGVYSVWIAHRVECSTGVVGNLLIVILMISPIYPKIKHILAKSSTLVIFLFVINFLFLDTSVLLSNLFIQHIIVNILHKDMSLTGRLPIYARLSDIIEAKKWFGYGYNNSIVEDVIGYGNAQNGVLQIAIDYGIIGIVFFIEVIISSAKKSLNYSIQQWPLYCMIYSMMICSLVEISFNYHFFIILALLQFPSRSYSLKNANKIGVLKWIMP